MVFIVLKFNSQKFQYLQRTSNDSISWFRIRRILCFSFLVYRLEWIDRFTDTLKLFEEFMSHENTEKFAKFGFRSKAAIHYINEKHESGRFGGWRRWSRIEIVKHFIKTLVDHLLLNFLITGSCITHLLEHLRSYPPSLISCLNKLQLVLFHPSYYKDIVIAQSKISDINNNDHLIFFINSGTLLLWEIKNA